MKAQTKLIVLILMIALVAIVIASTFTLAYWSGGASVPIADTDAVDVDNSENATTKYLIFAPINSYATDYCFEYTDASGWLLKYEYGADYILEGGSNKAGSRAAASASDISAVSSTITGVKVIGYIGTLGQYEDLIIPSTISWNSQTLNVTKIELNMMEYEEPLNLITSVVIPSSVTSIDGVSFTNANNLSKVYFNNTTLPTISQYAFRGTSTTYYKKNAGGEYITATIR